MDRKTYQLAVRLARGLNNRRWPFAAGIVAALAIATGASALGQQVLATPGPIGTPASASPSASASPPSSAAQKAYLASLLRDLDPCAGPLELDSKTGITPCVYVLGEAALSFGYASVNAPGSLTATGLRGGMAQLNFSGHFAIYPSLQFEIGVTKHAEISIIVPSVINSNVPTSSTSGGTSDAQLSYKQLVFANTKAGSLASLSAIYEAPTGNAPFAATAPSYRIEAIVGQSLPAHFGVNFGLPIVYEATANLSQAQNKFGFTFAPSLVPYWQSPGGTFLGLILTHKFSPNVTPIALSFLQLIGRHVQIGATYGGVNVHSDGAGPVSEIVNVRTSVSPRLLSLNVYFLVGASDVPPALVKLQKAAALQDAQGQK